MKYVIIGNSAAAIGTVEGIRQYDADGAITIISDEPHHTYSRPLISYWISGKVEDNNIYYRDENFYAKNNVDTIFGKKAVKISGHHVELDDGEKVHFDRLMVATGSKPFVPPMKGIEKVKNCFTFMTWDSVKAIKEKISDGTKVLIIGAGLIGLKAAEAMYHMNADITVVDLADRILPSILDKKAGDIMKEYIANKGTKFQLGTSVEEFSANSATLKNGNKIDFDVLIIAVGVRPNTELVAEAGGNVNKGIKTDDTQRTSLSDVFAAGDCTESYDISSESEKILALLPNAYMQGEVAGKNMAGSEAHYTAAIPMNAIGFYGLHIITAGSYDGDEFVETDGNNYKKLVFKNNHLVGYILMGDVARAGIYTTIIKEKLPVTDLNMDLLKNKPQMMLFAKSRREEKLGGITPKIS